MQVFRCAGVKVCRCAGVQVCRGAGVQVYRCAGVQVCTLGNSFRQRVIFFCISLVLS